MCLELNLCPLYGQLGYDSSFQFLKVLKHVYSQTTDEAADTASVVKEMGNAPLIVSSTKLERFLRSMPKVEAI